MKDLNQRIAKAKERYRMLLKRQKTLIWEASTRERKRRVRALILIGSELLKKANNGNANLKKYIETVISEMPDKDKKLCTEKLLEQESS